MKCNKYSNDVQLIIKFDFTDHLSDDCAPIVESLHLVEVTQSKEASAAHSMLLSHQLEDVAVDVLEG